MQQAADRAALVVQAQRQGAVQIGNHEQRLGRDMVSVRLHQHFRQLCYHLIWALRFLKSDAALNGGLALSSESRF
jgi:hypothetical protein